MFYTIYFSVKSPETGEYVPLVDQYGNDVTIKVEAPSKSATYQHPDVVSFCQQQGNDCRVRRVV